MAALDSLSFTFTPNLQWNASVTNAGAGTVTSVINSSGLASTLLSTTAAAAVGGANQMYALDLAIPASSSSVIDMANFTDILGRASQSIVRLKEAYFFLVSASQTMPSGVVGNACESVTIGNAVSDANALNLSSASTTFNVTNGGCQVIIDGSAAGITVDSSHKNIKVLNNSSTLVAHLFCILVGGVT